MTRAGGLLMLVRVSKASGNLTVEIDHFDMVVEGLENGLTRDAGLESW